MNNQLKIYCTTDCHLGHDRLIELCGRPKNFSELVLKGLSEIPAGAILICLGDVNIGNDAKWHDDIKNCTEHLKRRILVLGNHDNKSTTFYLDHGWDWVCDWFGMECFGKKIIFTHKPVLDLPLGWDYNVHGHLHNTGHREGGGQPFHKLLAIENTNYKAVNLEKFING